MAIKKNLVKSTKPATKAPQAASRAGVSTKSQPVAQKAALRPSASRKIEEALTKKVDKVLNKQMGASAALAVKDVSSSKTTPITGGKIDKKSAAKKSDASEITSGDKTKPATNGSVHYGAFNGKANGKDSANGKSNDKSNGKEQGDALPEVASGPLPKAETGLEKDLVKKPAGSLKSPLRIFQIYSEPWQRDLLDPNFAPLDNSKGNSELMDFAVFEQLLKSDYVKDAQLWGALSWRFAELTGMSGADWVKNIQSHPGYDVYFCNPYPQIEALYHNGWMQGETAHPQFFALSQAIFQVTGLPLDELTSLNPSDNFSSANFFVASPKFWAAYLPWVRNILTLANKKLPPKVRDLMHSKLADKQGVHNGATYIPFIIERLFPVFMKTAGKSLKSYKIALPERERELNVHLKLLREMKDVAHRTKSAWLGVCWVNYRNLYLTQINGKEWSKKYLRSITPTDIKFS